MIRSAKGNDIVALTAMVMGNASAKGSKNGLMMMNSPVPMTNGDAASARKLMDSIAKAVRFESDVMSPASAVANVVVIRAAGIAMETEFSSAGQTCVGSDQSDGRPLRMIEIRGANKKKVTARRTTVSMTRVPSSKPSQRFKG